MQASETPTIYTRVIGSPPADSTKLPLVLLHGLMGFSANWGKIWPSFEADRQVLVLDQRGHGKSDKPTQGYSPLDYALDVKNILDHLGWHRAHIVGHSMGGRVAMIFAEQFPQITASLIMEDSGAEANPQRILWIKNLLGKIPTPFHDRVQAKKYFEENFAKDPMTGGFLHANLEPKENGAIDWRFYAPGMIETIEKGRAVDGMDTFRKLNTEILLVRGGRSTEFPEDEAMRMRDSNPRAQLVTIEGAGHFVHAEKPQEFSTALQDFLTQVEQG